MEFKKKNSPPKKAKNPRENINEKHIRLLTNSLGSPKPLVGGGKLNTRCILPSFFTFQKFK